MLKEYHVDTLKRGNVFRSFLIDILGERIRRKNCHVDVYKIKPASHTVCRYEFEGENYSVIAKFFAEPTGWKRDYDPVKSMEREFKNLEIVEKVIDVPRPLAANRKFSCALVTECVYGRPLYKFMKSENGLYEKLTAIAHLLRKLHEGTRSNYHKEGDFYKFHQTLDQLGLERRHRETFNQLLGYWWYNEQLDWSYGCMIHHDANPVNYVFEGDKVYALDFESARLHANPVHDLGVMAAELKHYFAIHKGDANRAEPYIGHFLWRYSQSLEEFRRITQALPFFMALGLLRMGRLGIDPDNYAYILNEAMACLTARH
jgi:tRNA A-37 threonylcarbamoyl transferase component Bud32